MSTVTTRRNAGKDKPAITPTTTQGEKSNKSEQEMQEKDDTDTEPNLNLSSLTNDQKLDFLCKRMDELSFMAKEMKKLKKDNEEKDKKIMVLEHRIESLEQSTRRDDVVVSGFDPGPIPLARIVSESVSDERNEDAPQNVQESLEDKLVTFMNSHEIPLRKEDISECHTLGRRETGREQPIVIRFVSRKSKYMMLANGYKLKNLAKRVYINEHLTKKNSNLAHCKNNEEKWKDTLYMD